MPEVDQVDASWVDIVPPSAVATPLNATMAVLFAAVLVLALVLTFYYWRSPKQKARRYIQLLIRKERLQIDQRRNGCHLIARELGKAFGVARLSLVSFPGAQQHEWEAFLQLLDNKRFSASAISADELAQLARQAINWLKVRQWST